MSPTARSILWRGPPPSSGSDAWPAPSTVGQYRDLLLAAGFVGAAVTLTADHGDGVHSAIVQAVKPAISPGLEIRPMREDDAGQVLAIYQAGLDSGQASFETLAPSWEDFTAGRLPHPRYVATDTETGEVVGWVAASRVSARPVYAGVVEHSVYVHPGCQGHGIGRALLTAFIAGSQDAGIWTIQSGIFPENAPSLSLHQALGFRVIGTRNASAVTTGLARRDPPGAAQHGHRTLRLLPAQDPRGCCAGNHLGCSSPVRFPCYRYMSISRHIEIDVDRCESRTSTGVPDDQHRQA